MTTYEMLWIVNANREVSAADMAGALGAPHASVSAAMGRAKKSGLLHRRRARGVSDATERWRYSVSLKGLRRLAILSVRTAAAIRDAEEAAQGTQGLVQVVVPQGTPYRLVEVDLPEDEDA